MYWWRLSWQVLCLRRWGTFHFAVGHGKNLDAALRQASCGQVEILMTSYDTFR